MLARFFIDRPILAWVISVVIILLGGIAAALLPVAEYPEITPPTVQVTAKYPGANAQVVADTVAAPIGQHLDGMPPISANTFALSPGYLAVTWTDRKSTRLNSSHQIISYAVFCLKT